MSKKKFITQEAANQLNLKDFDLQGAKTIPFKSIDFFKKQKNKKKEIYIYDIGFHSPQKIIPINNHINKTGSNPLLGNKKNKIFFYDITTIYVQQKKGKIVECFGAQSPPNIKTKYIQGRFLCHHIIAAHCAGFQKIFAYIID